MKIWENTITAPELGSSGAKLLAEDSMLFDIETTGFSATYTTLYLTFSGNHYKLTFCSFTARHIQSKWQKR